jgi:hypothetical protein
VGEWPDDTTRPSMSVVSPEGIDAALAEPYQPRVGDEVETTLRGYVSHIYPAGFGGMPHATANVRKHPKDAALCVAVTDLRPVRPTSDKPAIVGVARPQYDDPRNGYAPDVRDTTAGETSDEPGDVE